MIRIALLVPLFGALPLNLLADDASVRHQRLNDLIVEEWKAELQLQPEMATFFGERGYDDKLSDLSVAGSSAAAVKRREFLKRLNEIDTAGLSEQDQLNQELLIWNLEDALAGYEFREYEMPLDQFNGYHLIPGMMVSFTPFLTQGDYENYLSRLHALPRTFQAMINAARAGMRDGHMPPKFLMEKVVRQGT